MSDFARVCHYIDEPVPGLVCVTTLMKDNKSICRTQCLNSPFQLPPICNISEILRPKVGDLAPGLPESILLPNAENSRQHEEWIKFMKFLKEYNKVARAKVGSSYLYICPPKEGSSVCHAVMLCEVREELAAVAEPATRINTRIPANAACAANIGSGSKGLVGGANSVRETSQPDSRVGHSVESITRRADTHAPSKTPAAKTATKFNSRIPANAAKINTGSRSKELDGGAKAARETSQPDARVVDKVKSITRGSDTRARNIPAVETGTKLPESNDDSYNLQVANRSSSRANSAVVGRSGALGSSSTRFHPSFLRTLGQSHSGWAFGAIAELVDNARDAKTTKLEIYVDMVFSKTTKEYIPMLSVIDDGHGMSHQDILRITSFGHECEVADDASRIGRYGIGFKSGAMRLGKDALVLSQTANSRSIAFLSQTFNEGKDNLEIPIVSYERQGRRMDLDTRIQSEALAKSNLEAIKEFSPFNEYLIGEKAGLFNENGTGTQIYIWNLDKWGSDYCLEWQNENDVGSSFHKGDILIRSRRIRTRPGQTSRTVPLDYSLKSYLEVMFIEPRMKIYVQGSQVKSRPLAKSLSRTAIADSKITGKPVQLIIGCSPLERKQANCGIFLYWRGRLIEAYKRVGGMVHSADIGRGVIGVIDVTDIMDEGTGESLVLNNKQGFQDSELYAQLEGWMGRVFDTYWDDIYDSLRVEKGTSRNKPDNDWVQCDKCRKWRVLSPGSDTSQLPLEWFCYMDPFFGTCDIPEEKVTPGVVTVSTKRGGYDALDKSLNFKDKCPKGSSSDLLRGRNVSDDDLSEVEDKEEEPEEYSEEEEDDDEDPEEFLEAEEEEEEEPGRKRLRKTTHKSSGKN